jgi:hypothetical protein
MPLMGKMAEMDHEAERHFIGSVPAERECSGRVFDILVPQKGDTQTRFRCQRCGRELFGELGEGKSSLAR